MLNDGSVYDNFDYIDTNFIGQFFYQIVVVLFVKPLLFYFYVNLMEHESKYHTMFHLQGQFFLIKQSSVYSYTKCGENLIRKEIPQLKRKIMDSFYASTSMFAYSRPDLQFLYLTIACLIPWKLNFVHFTLLL